MLHTERNKIPTVAEYFLGNVNIHHLPNFMMIFLVLSEVGLIDAFAMFDDWTEYGP